MGRIIISANITLDGVVDDPTGEEGAGHGGWFGWIDEKNREAWAEAECQEARSASALLLGRRSDAWFATRWLTREGAWADALNGLPKYVVSSTLRQPAWTNSTVLNGDVPDEVAELKRTVDGDIVVYGSIQLAHALLRHDLADELRLITFPLTVGTGRRLFPTGSAPKPFHLASLDHITPTLPLLTYRPAPRP